MTLALVTIALAAGMAGYVYGYQHGYQTGLEDMEKEEWRMLTETEIALWHGGYLRFPNADIRETETGTYVRRMGN